VLLPFAVVYTFTIVLEPSGLRALSLELRFGATFDEESFIVAVCAALGLASRF